MAKKIISDLDLNQNEIQNAVVQNLASAPLNPVAGQTYYNTSDNTGYIYNGTLWVALSGGGSGGSGDVTGPSSATDNAIARFDSTTGKIIQNSLATIDDSGNLSATNLSGNNTGDQSASDFDIKDLTDSTSLKTTWSGKQDALGYTAENSANKKTTLADNSDTYYPSQKAVKTAVDAKVTANTAITGATKTKITYDTKGLVTSGADATTADITDSTNKRYVTDAQLVVIGNTSNTNTGDETTSTIKTKLGAATASADGYVTSTQITKLNGIAAGAEVNVNADWNATSGDAQILNKPTIPDPYTLPTASTTTLGGVKVDGITVTITDGAISSPDEEIDITYADFQTLVGSSGLISGKRYNIIEDEATAIGGTLPNDVTKTLVGDGTWKQYISRNNSTSATVVGFSSDTYLTGSYITFPYAPLVGTTYRLLFNVTKTSAGTATPIIYIRTGTAGSTSDTARLTFTFGAGTAVADVAFIEVLCMFRVVGGSAVLQGMARATTNLTTTGWSNAKKSIVVNSSAFNSTTNNLGIGASYNGGASATHTVTMVRAELIM